MTLREDHDALDGDRGSNLRKKMEDWQEIGPGTTVPYDETIVDVRQRNGIERYSCISSNLNWGIFSEDFRGAEIIAYRISPVQGAKYDIKFPSGRCYKIGETDPVVRGKTSAERKAEPIHAGVLRYFPDALAAVARLSKAGNDKHNPGQPLHWSRHKSNDHLDCVARHIITPDKPDPDSGESHLVHAAWRVLAALQLQEEERLAKAGIENLSGVKPDDK
jgi:hypothetical protein